MPFTNRQLTFFVFFLAIAIIAIHACTKPENDPQNSANDGTESHYNDRVCMDCHYNEGPGEGWFNLAGTAHGEYLNGNVKVYSANTGDLMHVIPIDLLGNFYTTDRIDYSQGVYFHVEKANGEVIPMQTIAYHGACAVCHGTGGNYRDGLIDL